MTQDLYITESLTAYLSLTSEQARRLQELGRKLTSQSQRQIDQDDAASTRTAIECVTSDGSTWKVRVANAIGVIGLPEARLVVQPKIPFAHLAYLLRAGVPTPRLAQGPIKQASSENFWELLASWFLGSLEALLNSGLSSTYVPACDDLAHVRGRIDPMTSAMSFARGRLSMTCEYEEFSVDTPLNRVLRAAARLVARSRVLPAKLRSRARRALIHLDGVSELRRDDLRITLNRDTSRYGSAIANAHMIIKGHGMALESGTLAGSTFLLPTPDAIEDAMRQRVRHVLAAETTVVKGRRSLAGTSLTINPDLVMKDIAIGDVKYKIWDGTWKRPDLYQLTAFATGYRITQALHIGFTRSNRTTDDLTVGSVSIRSVLWLASPEITPEHADEIFQNETRTWWNSVMEFAELEARSQDS
ncbi:hypothetical protein ATN37_03485 [Rhodococcus sp. MH15]|uniref:McrC family protein n=1 Tax=Rhodococcus TaxID=1827 RepID=UPI001C4EF0F5|nr:MULTISPECIES: McrC family protein [Rhodococcus]MBW0288830.1 hypothetical protein [Rhodococcus sp. MH15]MCT6736337.1 McrC family protein [Rhodococcus qingshengii]